MPLLDPDSGLLVLAGKVSKELEHPPMPELGLTLVPSVASPCPNL